MSSQKGNVRRSRAPAHQNKHAFKHNKNSRRTKVLEELPNEGLCGTCWRQIEWRKKYRKYKPLKTARKCNSCREPTVIHAYHVICFTCAEQGGGSAAVAARKKAGASPAEAEKPTGVVCAKCLEPRSAKSAIQKDDDDASIPQEIVDMLEDPEKLKLLLVNVTEARRRTVFRAVDQGDLELAVERLVALGIFKRPSAASDDDDDDDDDDDEDEVSSDGGEGAASGDAGGADGKDETER
jgi:Uncharacterized conserved protein (DUF2039)